MGPPDCFPLCRAEIAGIELVVLAALGDELVVRAALDDAPLLEHHDAVAVSDSRKPVGDDERRAPLHQRIHAGLHERLGARVDGRGRLVENQHGRVGDRRAGDGEQLALVERLVKETMETKIDKS